MLDFTLKKPFFPIIFFQIIDKMCQRKYENAIFFNIVAERKRLCEQEITIFLVENMRCCII